MLAQPDAPRLDWARPSSRRLAWFVRCHLGELCEAAHSVGCMVHPVGARLASRVVGPCSSAIRLAAVTAVPSRGPLHWRSFRDTEEFAVFAGSPSRLSWLAMHVQCGQVSLTPLLNEGAPRRACSLSFVAPVNLVR